MINLKKSLLFAATMALVVSNSVSAQEFTLDSIAANTTPIIIAGSGMNQMTYVLYEKAGKKNKVKFAMLDPMLAPMMIQELKTKGLGRVMTFAGNDQSSLFLFYDDSKKKATLVSYSPDGNILGEKAYKGITANDEVTLYRALNPESFVLVSLTSKKAGYKVEGINGKLETTWTHNGKQKMLSVAQSMDMLNITSVSKSSNGNEQYSITSIQTETGEVVAENIFKYEEQLLYPTFSSQTEGMAFTGGVFFKDGNPNSKTPDGVFIAQVAPDGNMAEISTAPYSLIVEDIKGDDITEKLASGKYKLLPVGTMRKMDGSGSVLICELFSRKKTADGNTRFEVMDLVAINFDMEQKYESLQVIKKPNKSTTVKGPIAKTNNDWGVATWLFQNDFFDYKLTQDLGGQQSIGYTTTNSGEQSLCFNSIGSTQPNCVDYGTRILTEAPAASTYSSSKKTLASTGVLSANRESAIVYENNGSLILLYTIPLIAGETDIMQPPHEKEPPPNDEPHMEKQH